MDPLVLMTRYPWAVLVFAIIVYGVIHVLVMRGLGGPGPDADDAGSKPGP